MPALKLEMNEYVYNMLEVRIHTCQTGNVNVPFSFVFKIFSRAARPAGKTKTDSGFLDIAAAVHFKGRVHQILICP